MTTDPNGKNKSAEEFPPVSLPFADPTGTFSATPQGSGAVAPHSWEVCSEESCPKCYPPASGKTKCAPDCLGDPGLDCNCRALPTPPQPSEVDVEGDEIAKEMRERAAAECDEWENLTKRARDLCDPKKTEPVSMWDRYDDVVKSCRTIAQKIRDLPLEPTP